MNRYVEAFKKYAEFSGRSRRSAYWMFVLFNILFSIVALALDYVFGTVMREFGFGPIYILYGLVVFIPGLALSVRRLHDVGKSGWMLLVGMIPLVGPIWLLTLYATEGESRDNQYGPDPKGTSSSNLGITHGTTSETRSGLSSGSDNIILFIVVWLVFSRLFYFLIPLFNIDFYSTGIFKIVNIIFSIVWGAIPILLALSIKDKQKQVILFVLAGVYVIMTIIEIIQNFTGSFFY
ncbi:DUF805 domain-containing protein [uncultured Dokdonia sp.]|uniref:DUF805 domain-containing protein n=1 Tax=uncultured Dokdonia sp. TaxID=575653 RepID=UPI00344BC811